MCVYTHNKINSVFLIINQTYFKWIGRSWVRFPMVSLDFFHWCNPSSRTMALGL